MPNAPASISRRTSSRIWSSCAGVGGLFSRPITYSRIVGAPMNDATFCEIPCFSRWLRYSASVVHSISYFRSPCASRRRFFISSLSGPIELSPKIWVVTPCRSSLNERLSTNQEVSEWESMLMRPGATAIPLASMIVGAVARLRFPTATIRSPFNPTSAFTGARPVPL